jgi:bifunctional DNA-binding transcriptional regulator/antitoxin component of YhaV-PrlF toxin-antitoxin module
MTDSYDVQVAQRGLVTLPKALREAYGLEPGVHLALLDLGGVFVLSKVRSQVDDLADAIAQQLAAEGESLETILAAVRETRATYEA